MVAMNAQTYKQDVREVSPGGFLLYDSSWPREDMMARDDISVLGVPLSKLCNDAFGDPRVRILMKNITYVGALAALLALDIEVIRARLSKTYAKKATMLEDNLTALDLGFDFASLHFECPLPVHVEAMDKTSQHMMIDGNTAAGLGCVYAGATVAAWYPITPSTSLMDAFNRFCERFRRDPDTGARRFCVVQAEDELAAMGMVLGASWAGARAFTATSGPGVSLMAEFLGFAYYAEIPAVLFNVQRAGPSTGLPTRTQQSDLLACAYASHGDTRQILLFPSDPEECFYFAVQAFDLADRLQTPVIVMSDLDIGMNDWMCPRLEWDESYEPDRGKVLSEEEIDRLGDFFRYEDKDGDGICYRTYPGVHRSGAYFTRGSGHNRSGGYTEDPAEYKEVLDRLIRKWQGASALVPQPVVIRKKDARTGIIAIGSSDGAVREVLPRLNEPVDYMRLRAFPANGKVKKFIDSHDRVFVVEQNRDAQLCTLLKAELDIQSRKLIPVLHYDGFPISSGHIERILLDAMSEESVA
jgi:2-oxoglutarate ferredoxin oxidoreductase subunit alpha